MRLLPVSRRVAAIVPGGTSEVTTQPFYARGVGDLLFRALYRLLHWLDPVLRWSYRSVGMGNVHELFVRSRRSGRQRSVLLTLLHTDSGLYLGHPNGAVAWTRDLEAAGEGELRWRDNEPLLFRPVRVPDGPERDAVIRATWVQQPFPGSLIYSVARRHVRRCGVYFRLDPVGDVVGAA